jgi:hypothetical protein
MSSDDDRVMGAVCLDVPVISSFMPNDFSRFALINRLEEKESSYEANQYKSYYNIAQNRSKMRKKMGLKILKPPEMSKYTKKEIKDNHVKYKSDSLLDPFFRFFAKRPYIQMGLLAVITAFGICILSLGEDYALLEGFPLLKDWV